MHCKECSLSSWNHLDPLYLTQGLYQHKKLWLVEQCSDLPLYLNLRLFSFQCDKCLQYFKSSQSYKKHKAEHLKQSSKSEFLFYYLFQFQLTSGSLAMTPEKTKSSFKMIYRQFLILSRNNQQQCRKKSFRLKQYLVLQLDLSLEHCASRCAVDLKFKYLNI